MVQFKKSQDMPSSVIVEFEVVDAAVAFAKTRPRDHFRVTDSSHRLFGDFLSMPGPYSGTDFVAGSRAPDTHPEMAPHAAVHCFLSSLADPLDGPEADREVFQDITLRLISYSKQFLPPEATDKLIVSNLPPDTREREIKQVFWTLPGFRAKSVTKIRPGQFVVGFFDPPEAYLAMLLRLGWPFDPSFSESGLDIDFYSTSVSAYV